MLRPYPGSRTQDERQRRRHPVCSIRSLWCGLQSQQMRDHCAHLVLLRAAGADDRFLDHGRRVLRDLELGLLCREQDDAARMSQHERGAHVLMIESVLEREHGWLMAFDEIGDFVM